MPPAEHDCEHDADYSTFCRGCDRVVCEPCAGEWEVDGEYDAEGRAHCTVTARCKECHEERKRGRA